MFKVHDYNLEYFFPYFSFDKNSATYKIQSQNGLKGSRYQILCMVHLAELITSL